MAKKRKLTRQLSKFKKIIICPLDGTRHIDKGRFALTPHSKIIHNLCDLCVRKDSKTGKIIGV